MVGRVTQKLSENLMESVCPRCHCPTSVGTVDLGLCSLHEYVPESGLCLQGSDFVELGIKWGSDNKSVLYVQSSELKVILETCAGL